MRSLHPGQPEPTTEVTDARQSLRLVKIRLALTLAAVAILPIAAVAPLIRSITDDPRAALEARLSAQAEHAAAQITSELRDVRAGLVVFAKSPVLAPAFGAKAPKADAAAAINAALASLMARPSGTVNGAALLNRSGAPVILAAPAGAFLPVTTAPETTPEFLFEPGSAGGAAHLQIAVPVPGASGADPIGSVVASIGVPGLLRWATADLVPAGQSLGLLDASGNSLATLVLDAGAQGGQGIQVNSTSGPVSLGSALIVVPGVESWRVEATAPSLVASVPLPTLAALVVLLLLILVGTWWMARQILAPAAALERRRAHFETLYESAREAALRDNLTGLGNHRAFQEAITKLSEQSRRYNRPMGLLLLDIDEFKRVNDTRGHAVGDELLAEVGQIIRGTIRNVDSGFRIGGDEFAVILPETDIHGAEIAARRLLRRGLEDRGTGGYRAPVSFSIGVTACPEYGTSRLELTAQADAALYRGKRAGRTCVTVFDPTIDKGHVDEGMRSELSFSISAVIESGGLSAVYQPIVHVATGRILGYEGLVRVGSESGFPHTGALFDAAEIAGRVLDLDRAALEVVLAGAQTLPPETLISLNISPQSFEAPEFNASVVLAILRRHGIDPERVLVELTEREAVRDADRLRVAIKALQEAGVRIAADDVGAGNAGLRLLSQFQFDVVKIDLSLVQGGASREQTMSVLTTLIDLARRWGALTIAEGVETADQLRMIRDLGVDAGQGYLLGRPGAMLTTTALDLDAIAGDPAPRELVAVPMTRATDRDPWTPPPRDGLPEAPTAASVIASRAAGTFTSR